MHSARDRELLASGGRVSYEASVMHRDGSRRDVMLIKVAVPGDDGGPSGILTVLMDVSEFRAAERATTLQRGQAIDGHDQGIDLRAEGRCPLPCAVIGIGALADPACQPGRSMHLQRGSASRARHRFDALDAVALHAGQAVVRFAVAGPSPQ